MVICFFLVGQDSLHVNSIDEVNTGHSQSGTLGPEMRRPHFRNVGIARALDKQTIAKLKDVEQSHDGSLGRLVVRPGIVNDQRSDYHDDGDLDHSSPSEQWHSPDYVDEESTDERRHGSKGHVTSSDTELRDCIKAQAGVDRRAIAGKDDDPGRLFRTSAAEQMLPTISGSEAISRT